MLRLGDVSADADTLHLACGEGELRPPDRRRCPCRWPPGTAPPRASTATGRPISNACERAANPDVADRLAIVRGAPAEYPIEEYDANVAARRRRPRTAIPIDPDPCRENREREVGFELVENVLANRNAWDGYESTRWNTADDRCRDHPDGPDAGTVRVQRDGSRRAHLEFGRRYFGSSASVSRERRR